MEDSEQIKNANKNQYLILVVLLDNIRKGIDDIFISGPLLVNILDLKPRNTKLEIDKNGLRYKGE